MDDQALIRTYGNIDLPEGTPERPLVTFAVFAYNQEKYIREAVEGAFSQTYSPLEIILSDDCSSDRTFEIMEEMARTYRGPHRAKVNKTENNVGTIDHILTVAAKAAGELIVVAAGDDISNPKRVEELAVKWISSKAEVVQSHYSEFNESEGVTNDDLGQQRSQTVERWFWNCGDLKIAEGYWPTIIGCTAAYRKSVFDGVPQNGFRCLNEDALFTILANLSQYRIETVRQVLVNHRRHSTNVSSDQNAKGFCEVRANELSRERFANSSVKFIEFYSTYFSSPFVQDKAPFAKRVAENMIKDLPLLRLHASFWKLSPYGRIRVLLSARVDCIKFVIPRLLGLEVFAIFKMLLGRS